MAILCLILACCINEDVLRGNPDAPIITAVEPASGNPGDEIDIIGEKFTNQDSDTIYFNGAPALILNHSNTNIRVIVPQDATTGPVSLKNNNGIALGPDFEVGFNNIKIDSLIPNVAKTGSQIAIYGVGFNNLSPGWVIKFVGSDATGNLISDALITVNVPVNAVTGNLNIDNAGQIINGPLFTLDTSVPSTIATVTTFSEGDGNNPLLNPFNIVSANGSVFYVTDAGSHQIKRIDSNGNITVLAGAGSLSGFSDGTGTDARFDSPAGLTIDPDGNLYVTDVNNHAIRRVTPQGVVTTIAGFGQSGFANGQAQQEALFNAPSGIAYYDGSLYVSDFNNHAIRRINLSTEMVTTIAGNGSMGFVNGTGAAARFYSPTGITVDNNTFLVADLQNHAIRRVTTNGVVTTIAGNSTSGNIDGPVNSARFNFPYFAMADSEGAIYVADGFNHRIRKISAGSVSTLAGSSQGFQNGVGTNARFDLPTGLYIGSPTEIWVCDYNNGRIRKITIE